jgi:hypothetical protein
MSGIEQELVTRFKYHPPKPEQVRKYEGIREVGLSFARLIVDFVPDCRERALALTKLEEAIMHANAGIARRT